jgi:hypothetical protein
VKFLLGLILSAVFANAQSFSLSLSPASVQAGGTTTLTITYADSSPSSNTAAMEWALSLPAGITAGSYTAGAALTAAVKPISCGASICVAAGDGATLNDTVIGSGVVATVPLTISSTITPGSEAITLTSLLGATATNPSTVALTVTPATETVLSRYDLNGDGVVNATDVGIMLGDVIGTAICSGQSLNVGDGKCDVEDLEFEILAALGIIH